MEDTIDTGKEDTSEPSSSQGSQIHQPRVIELCHGLWNSTKKDKVLLRIICKGKTFTFTNRKGNAGQILKYIAADKESQRIQILLYDTNVATFSPQLELDHLYYISEFTLVTSKKEYDVFDSSFDLILNEKAIVTPADDESSNFTTFIYKFENHSAIEGFMDTGYIFNLLGRVINIEVYSGRKKIILLDKENQIANITIWPDVVGYNFLDQLLPTQDICVLGITSLKAKIFNKTHSVSTTQFTRLLHDMADPIISAFFRWAKEHSLQLSPCKSPTLTPQKNKLIKKDHRVPAVTIQYVVNHPAEVGNEFSIFAYVSRVDFQKDLWYDACPYCTKKIKNSPADNPCCPTYAAAQPPPTLKYLLRAYLIDWTKEEIYVTFFDDISQQILGQSASSMLAAFDDTEKLHEEIMQKIQKPFIFCITKQEKKFSDGRTFTQYIVDSAEEDTLPTARRRLGPQFSDT